MDEQSVQRTLSEWLIDSVGVDVYWAEDPDDEYGTFGFEGLNDRPDMLTLGSQNIVAEVKDGKDSAGIYDAMSQLHRYWKAYEFDDATVRVDDRVVDIDAFLLATQYSKEGHLFKPAREQGERETYDPASEGWNATERPRFEYARTEAIPRILWRYAWHEAEYRQDTTRGEIDAALGVLLCDGLDDDRDQASLAEFGDAQSQTSDPAVLCYSGETRSSWEYLG